MVLLRKVSVVSMCDAPLLRYPVGMKAEPLENPEPVGVIWTALVLDYPGHSFSHLGLFFGVFS